MIKKIRTIKNLAVFNDFDWDSTVRDSANRPLRFQQLNIIYGRNYSGKTTLSRIVRGLETGRLSEKYENPTFTLEFENGTIADQATLLDHGHAVRVFNEDFVKDNLKVFYDEEEGIAPFAVLGEGNAQLVAELESKEKELGTEEAPGTVLSEELRRKVDWAAVKLKLDTANGALENQLREKANAPEHGIKHNRLFGDANYDIRRIRADIRTVTAKGYTSLNEAQLEEYKELLAEMKRPEIPSLPALSLESASITAEARSLVEREVPASEPLQELLKDASLQEWVRAGREHHENKRETCAFCGNLLPDNLWSKLDKHFNKESEVLREKITSLMARIDREVERTFSVMQLDVDGFYSTYMPQVKSLVSEMADAVDEYKVSLQEVREALGKRRDNIFRTGVMPDVADLSVKVERLRDEYEELRNKSNAYTASLAKNQGKARGSLRLHEVATFLATIQYERQTASIKDIQDELEAKKKVLDDVTARVADARRAIADLKARMNDERSGAERVNKYLSHHFGHPALSLQALSADEDRESRYRFDIYRDGKRAHHLSEGERGLIAFCYFLARLEDVNTESKKPIIWIDDPVSSLDDNHVFFLHSLIDSHIAQTNFCEQLFISTHSLTFLKYLKRLPKSLPKAYFLVHRAGSASVIQQMPAYLKEYVTEFHYLFRQIYRCATSPDEGDPNVDEYYNLGNSVRKFLEIYLSFRYPDVNESDRTKLERFLGDDPVAASLTNRIENEYSHLKGCFERGTVPVDVPTMKRMAQFVLTNIKKRDIDQYKSLLDSIGATESETEDADNEAEGVASAASADRRR